MPSWLEPFPSPPLTATGEGQGVGCLHGGRYLFAPLTYFAGFLSNMGLHAAQQK